MVPVSWGELIDKITILEIKRARLRSAEAVANAERELAALAAVLAGLDAPDGLAGLKTALAEVNGQLWEIEDFDPRQGCRRRFRRRVRRAGALGVSAER